MKRIQIDNGTSANTSIDTPVDVTENVTNRDIQELADTVPHKMWFSGARGGVLFLNARFYEFTGMKPGQGHGMEWCGVVHPDDLEKCLDLSARAEAIRTRQPWTFEYRLRQKDGKYHWHVARNIPLFDTAGAVRRWVGTATDIQKEKEADLKQRRLLREVLAAVTANKLRLCDEEADLPEPLSPNPNYSLSVLSPASLAPVRRLVNSACDVALLPVERAFDLVGAASEAAMNALVHGNGGECRIYANQERGQVQVWVTDNGGGISQDSLHRATLEQGFSSTGTMGQGFPLILRSADSVYLLTRSTGTTIVIEQGRDMPGVITRLDQKIL